MKFIIRWLGTAIAVGFAVWIVPGMATTGNDAAWISILLCALMLSIIDLSLKPLMQLLSLPLTILTFGIFALVVNTFMLYVAAWVSAGIFGAGISISSFGSAFVASIIISIVAAIMHAITGANREI